MNELKLLQKCSNIPACNKLDELIAYTILANFELLWGREDMARTILSHALSIASRLETVPGATLSAHTSKFACFACDFDGITEVMALPVIGDTLILPVVNLPELVRKIRQTMLKVIDIKDISIGYYSLQFDAAKIITLLNVAIHATNCETALDAVSDILKFSLRRKEEPIDPLQLAKDYFVLTRNLMQKGNITLTRIALQNAENVLHVLEAASGITSQQRRNIVSLKSNLQDITEIISSRQDSL